MKFSLNGFARKGNYRFQLKYNSVRDNNFKDKPYYLFCEEIDPVHDRKMGAYTEYSHRFATDTEALMFCEKVASGQISIQQLRDEENEAYEVQKAKEHISAEAEFASFGAAIHEMGMSLEDFRKAHKMYSNLSYDARMVMFNEPFFRAIVEDIAENFPVQLKKMALADWLDKYKSDVDICVVDKDTGEHYLNCLTYLSPKERLDPELNYTDVEKWLLSLPLDHIQMQNGCPLAVVQTDYSMDQTSFLLDGIEFDTVEWSNFYERANIAEADFAARLRFLDYNAPFEKPFDPYHMNVISQKDAQTACNLLLQYDDVFVAENRDDPNKLHLYGVSVDTEGGLHISSRIVPVERTKLSDSFYSTLDGKVAWSKHVANKEHTGGAENKTIEKKGAER